MSPLHRATIRAARSRRSPQWRSYASSSSAHVSGQSHNEPLGRGFYVSIAAIASSLALYKLSRSPDPSDPNAQPLITRYLEKLNFFQDEYEKRNTLHTAAIESAGHDKHLFFGTPGNGLVELRYPEVFDTGSPWNRRAGSSANLDEVRAHYRRQNAAVEAAQRDDDGRAVEVVSVLGRDFVPKEGEGRSGVALFLEAWGLKTPPGEK